MSRSWLEKRFATTEVRIAPGRVSIPQLRSGSKTQPCNAVVPAAGDDALPKWQHVLPVLENLLGGTAKPSIARNIRIVVGNDFVRYALLPWTNEWLTEAERIQLARTLLAERHGASKTRYDIVIERRLFDTPALVAAIDAEFISAIKFLTVRLGLKLVGITPAIIEDLNVHRVLRKYATGWLVDADDGRLTTLAFADGAWVNLGNERFSGLEEEIAATLLPTLRCDAIKFPALFKGTLLVLRGGGALQSSASEWPVVRLGTR